MHVLKFIGGLIAFVSVGLGIFTFQNPSLSLNTNTLHKLSGTLLSPPSPEERGLGGEALLDTALYPTVKSTIETQRKTWSSANKLSIAQDSISYLLGDSLAPYWIGTVWDFNGVSKKPQSGQIACGYFVYGLLEDAGFNLPRIKLSQATSEKSIKAIINETYIKRFSNKDMDTFVSSMQAWGDGIYLVGLDYHIGMLQVNGDEVLFIHSSVYPPVAVVIEDASSSAALTHTAYRIVGKLNNATTMQKWLSGSYFSLN